MTQLMRDELFFDLEIEEKKIDIQIKKEKLALIRVQIKQGTLSF